MSKAVKTKTDKPAPAEPHTCECSRYEVEIGDDPETMEYVGTGCTATTRSRFAMGHDAKLKAMLIRAGVEDRSVRRDGGGVVVVADALTMAQGHGFASRVAHGITRGLEKAEREAKHEQAARAVEQPTTAAVEVRAVQIRVGRWVYDALLSEDGSASYKTAKGAVKVIAAADVQIVDEFASA